MNPEKAKSRDANSIDEAIYKVVLDTLGDAIHVVDRALKIIYQNPAFSEWLVTLNLETKLIGKHITEAFPFLSTDTIEEYMEVFSSGNPHVITETTEIDGKEVVTEVRKIPIIEDGQVVQIITLLRDITDQIRFQRKIEESEDRYRKLYRNLSDALFQTNTSGVITMAGERAKAIFGYEKDELIGKHFTELLAPEERERIASAFRNRLVTLEDNREGFEAWGLKKDGKLFMFHITNTILYDSGNPIGYQSLVRDVTEMKRAEQAIMQQEQKYRALFEQNNDAVFILDLAGNHLELNQTATEMFGYSQEELVGRYFQDLAVDEEPNLSVSRTQALLSGAELPVYEQNLRRKDGTIVPSEVRVSLIRDQEKNPLYYQTIVRDISERKKNERAIREEHAKAQMYLDIAGVMLVALNSQGEVVLLNQKGCEILGYNEIEVMNNNWFEMFVPDGDREATWRAFQLLMQGKGEPVTRFENTVTTRSGDIRLISWQNQILKDREGNIIGTLSSGEDITDRKKILDALRTEKERYQILFETAPIAIAVTTDSGEFLDANWAFQEMLGYTLEELLKMPVMNVYANPDDREHLSLELDKEGKVRNLEVRLKRNDRAIIDTLLNVDYVDYDDRIVRLTTVRDITELNLTKKELEEARARAEFYADLLAHDLNNVHQGILVGTELLLLNQDLGEKTRTHGIAIREQVARGIDLIENVRKLSHMEGETTPKLVEIDLHTVLANALMLVQHAFPHKNAHFDIKFKPGQVTVLADEFLIDLFYNIIHNAMKYDTSDEVEIAIEIVRSTKEGFVEVAVVDNGPGISPSRKEDLFSRLEKGRTLGSGMGLTLVKHITERYGGRTWVEDRVPGIYARGSRFVVELPIKAP